MLTTSTTNGTAVVFAGVDTHASTHHCAVVDDAGRVLGDKEFPATAAGHQDLAAFARSLGPLDRVGVELTGSYGMNLTRALQAAGIRVVEVNTTDKATRARRGKDDRTDAIAAADKARSGMASATPKDTAGTVEAIRVLKIARDSAVTARTQALNQIKDLRITAPQQLRTTLEGLTLPQIAKTARAFRPDPARRHDPVQATKSALKHLGTRIAALDAEITAADKDLTTLVQATAPTLIARPQIGTQTAATLLVCAGANITRIRSEAAFARITGTAPVPVSSGKTTRMRLHRGGNRQANAALHLIAVGRLKNHPATRAYRDRKLTQGHSNKDAIRSLKRYIAREVFHALTTDLTSA